MFDARPPGPPPASAPPAGSTPGSVPRPFIKWVGGKGQLLPRLLEQVERARPIRRYHEPFVGGGALFFAVSARSLGAGPARLTDVNPRLVATYQAVRDDVQGVIEALQHHARHHSREHYYATRRAPPSSATHLAAWFIYLNRTGFNGLYRVNRRGDFNVPMGSYVNPAICDPDRLRAASAALAGVDIAHAPFESVLAEATAGDFVYFDPPYVPVSTTASFTSYTQDGFGPVDQERLVAVAIALRERGVRVLLSNSGSTVVERLYQGFDCQPVSARRAVNSRPDRRGPVVEYLITGF